MVRKMLKKPNLSLKHIIGKSELTTPKSDIQYNMLN